MRRFFLPTSAAVLSVLLSLAQTSQARLAPSRVSPGALLRSLPSFMQTQAGVGWTSEHGYCELCMYAVHQLQYGALPTCGNSAKASSFSTCSQVVQSIMTYAHDVLQLLAHGCYKYNPYRGWQTVRPCPAHVVCGRLTNMYDHEKKAHCPADFAYRLPQSPAGGQTAQTRNPLLAYALRNLQGRDPPALEPSPAEPKPSALPADPATAAVGADAVACTAPCGTPAAAAPARARESPFDTAYRAQLKELLRTIATGMIRESEAAPAPEAASGGVDRGADDVAQADSTSAAEADTLEEGAREGSETEAVVEEGASEVADSADASGATDSAAELDGEAPASTEEAGALPAGDSEQPSVTAASVEGAEAGGSTSAVPEVASQANFRSVRAELAPTDRAGAPAAVTALLQDQLRSALSAQQQLEASLAAHLSSSGRPQAGAGVLAPL